MKPEMMSVLVMITFSVDMTSGVACFFWREKGVIDCINQLLQDAYYENNRNIFKKFW